MARTPAQAWTGWDDVMARPGWTYRDRDSYRINSYGKPALTLQTLEGLVGEETMVRILRTFAKRGPPDRGDGRPLSNRRAARTRLCT